MAREMMSMLTAEDMIGDLFRRRQEVSRDEIVRKAEDEPLAPDVMTYFSHLPQGQYSKRKLVDTVNGAIRERRREREIGQLKVE